MSETSMSAQQHIEAAAEARRNVNRRTEMARAGAAIRRRATRLVAGRSGPHESAMDRCDRTKMRSAEIARTFIARRLGEISQAEFDDAMNRLGVFRPQVAAGAPSAVKP